MKRRGSILALLLCACLYTSVAATPEYQVKAAYIFNFTRFIDWPNAEPLSSRTICVYGQDPLGGFLDEALRGKLVHGLPTRIRRLPVGEESFSGCQVVFIGLKNNGQIEPILGRLKGQSILTVGESDGFADAGGMIGLVVEHGSVRFDLNLTALAGAHLKASSQLIEIGRVVGRRR